MRRKILALALACMGGLAATSAHAVAILGAPTPLFAGIDLRTVEINSSRGFAAAIDLRAPGIRFTGAQPAPQGVPIAGSTPAQQAETVAQTTSQFLLSSGTQYAINSGFFAPCCTAANEGKDVIGLTITDGQVVSPLDPTRPASLLLTSDNNAFIGTFLSVPAGIDDAVTGSDILVDNGINVAPTAATSFNGPNPRTAVGVSQDGNTLFLLTIDGRQPGYSVGTTLVETAEALLALGAYDGVNLDGGGSTAAVFAGGQGGATLINRPSGGAERFDGGNFGVFALPLAVPEPASALLLGLALAILVATRPRAAYPYPSSST